MTMSEQAGQLMGEMVDLVELALRDDHRELVDGVATRSLQDLALMAQLTGFLVDDLAECRGVSADVVLADLRGEIAENTDATTTTGT